MRRSRVCVPSLAGMGRTERSGAAALGCPSAGEQDRSSWPAAVQSLVASAEAAASEATAAEVIPSPVEGLCGGATLQCKGGAGLAAEQPMQGHARQESEPLTGTGRRRALSESSNSPAKSKWPPRSDTHMATGNQMCKQILSRSSNQPARETRCAGVQGARRVLAWGVFLREIRVAAQGAAVRPQMREQAEGSEAVLEAEVESLRTEAQLAAAAAKDAQRAL